MLEEELHILCADWISLKGIDDQRYRWFHHSPNGGFRRLGEARKFKRMGVKPGFPDWFNPWPSGSFQGLAIELKRPGGRATAEQMKWLRMFKGLKYRVAICSSFEGFQSGVEDYFKGFENGQTSTG